MQTDIDGYTVQVLMNLGATKIPESSWDNKNMTQTHCRLKFDKKEPRAMDPNAHSTPVDVTKHEQ